MQADHTLAIERGLCSQSRCVVHSMTICFGRSQLQTSKCASSFRISDCLLPGVVELASSCGVPMTFCQCAGLKARRRAQFAAAVRVAADLDEESLRLLLKFIPAWVKHSEYERAQCVRSASGRRMSCGIQSIHLTRKRD